MGVSVDELVIDVDISSTVICQFGMQLLCLLIDSLMANTDRPSKQNWPGEYLQVM